MPEPDHYEGQGYMYIVCDYKKLFRNGVLMYHTVTHGSIQGVSKKETEMKMPIPGELLNILRTVTHHILRHGVFFLVTRGN